MIEYDIYIARSLRDGGGRAAAGLHARDGDQVQEEAEGGARGAYQGEPGAEGCEVDINQAS